MVLFLSVLGPGIITGNVDNDAGGIATYSLAGAEYGYSLLWTLIPITLALIVVQEMCSRMAVVTGKGLSDLIRENYGVKITFWIMAGLLFTNYANTVSEFAGIAASGEIFGVSKYLSVPIAAAFVWFLVVRGNYRRVEKVFLFACVIYVTYVASGLTAKPNWGHVMRGFLVPSLPARLDTSYVVMLVGLVGTSIAPWMQFYLQASCVEKGIPVRDYPATRLDVVVGSILTDVVAFFIIVACGATLFRHGVHIKDAADAAVALRPLAGKYASVLFAAGLLNASLFAASILPLSTAYSVCEAMGWESGVDKTWGEAPIFFGLYTALIVFGAMVVMIPRVPLVWLMLVSQVINGVLLPVVLIYMLKLTNDKRMMNGYTNSRAFNAIAWVTVVVMAVLSVVMVTLGLRGL